MQVVVVYNPRSGSALPKGQLRSLFRDSDVKVLRFIDVTDDFEKHIGEYVGQTKITVVGYGGDGTLNTIAKQLAGTGTIFAPLPGGTLNHFTKDLGVDQDLANAIKRLPRGAVRTVDAAAVNGNLFLNNSSIGLYPSSLAERSRIESRLGKWPAAIYASIRALARFRLYSVTINGSTYVTPFIFVGNNHYNPDELMARQSLNKGLLSVHMINSGKRSALIKIALLALIGKLKDTDEFMSFETNRLTLNINRRAVRVSFDGEHARLATPITYEIKERSLTVLT